ncbi:MAG: site-2 protease family protein [Dehalococcoidales bacterium]|nr:site-2 protease family protein [Dehalococcoidales bacterium]
MGGAINIGKVFGIQLRIHYSWFFIFILLTLALVSPDWNSGFAWAIGVATCILFFVSVVAHELAHSLVGRANGIVVTSITLFIFGGMAMMTKEATQPKAELKMAAAGPACSAIIGGICLLIWLFAPGLPPAVSNMVLWLMAMNFALAVFNLIPGFPLDGGRIFRAVVWSRSGDFRRSTRIATRVGEGVGYFFIGAGVAVVVLSLFDMAPFGLNWFSGVWLAFIGWFLRNAARSSYRQTEWRETLRRFTADQVMSASYPAVPPDIDLARLVEEHVFTTGHRVFVVVGRERFEGILTLDNVKTIPRRDWAATRVRDIMTPLARLKVVTPEESALGIMEWMNGNDVAQVLVVKDGRVVGLITRDNLMRFLRVHSELNRN